MISTALGAPLPLAAAAFVAVVGGGCYAASAQQMDRINSALVGLVVVAFLVSFKVRERCCLGGCCRGTAQLQMCPPSPVPPQKGASLRGATRAPAAVQALLGKAAVHVEPSALLTSHWEAVPATLPTIALAFVFQNVVPVISSSLEVCSGASGTRHAPA